MRMKPRTGRNFQYFVFTLDCDIEPVPVPGLRIGRAGWLDYLVGSFGPGPKISLTRRLRRGDDYFTARTGGRIVSIGRICYADTAEVELEQREASLLSFQTLPEFRGRGLYVALMVSMLAHLKARGFERCYIWAEDSNVASLKGIRKAGFVPIEPAAEAGS